MFDREVAADVFHDQYRAWDDLNARYGVVEIRKFMLMDMCVADLRFGPLLNPQRLKGVYASLQGALFVEPEEAGGDFPNVYPRL